MNRTVKIALSGIICALTVAVIMLSGVITVGTFALPALAGLPLIIVVNECGIKHSVASYFISALFAFLFAPDKETALYYVMFFGYYPIVKCLAERIKNRLAHWAIKFAVFNAAMISAFFISLFVLSVPKDSFIVFGYYVPYLFLIVGNFVFFLYDFALSSMIVMYVRKWRKRIIKKW